LVVCAPRPDAKTDPSPMGDDEKADPGRALYLQGPQRASTRALLRVIKVPVAAPCVVVLKAAADHVKLWDLEDADKKNQHEITTPKALAVSDFPDPVKGFVAWAEGAKLTGSSRSAFTIEVTDVEDVTDTVAFTVGLAKIEVEIVRSDSAVLSGAVRVGIKE